METLIATLLALLCGLMFYRWVDRRHKIVLAKILGVIVVVALGAVGVQALLAARQRRQESARAWDQLRRELGALSVTFLPESTYHDATVGPKRRAYPDRIAFQVCNKSADTIDAFNIDARTWSKGHSERRSVLIKPVSPYVAPESLKSDVVLAPKACTIAVFWGDYVVRDSVEASATPAFRK